MTNRNLVSEGTSISVSSGSYAGRYQLVSANYGLPTDITITAVNGSTIADIIGRASTVDSSYLSDRLNILSVEAGANNFNSGNGATDTSDLASLATYLDARRAVGWRVIACTLMPQTHVNFTAARGALNTTIRTWVGLHCDALCDFAADPIMGPDAAASDTALYPDGIHPSGQGLQRLSFVYASVLNTFVSTSIRQFRIR